MSPRSSAAKYEQRAQFLRASRDQQENAGLVVDVPFCSLTSGALPSGTPGGTACAERDGTLYVQACLTLQNASDSVTPSRFSPGASCEFFLWHPKACHFRRPAAWPT